MSLTNSMASFRIHEDSKGENPVPALSAKLNQLGPIQTRRAALGDLDRNLVQSRLDVLKPLKTIDGTENEYKKIEGKKPVEKVAIKTKTEPEKTEKNRTPLKEIEDETEKTLSPMSVDDSPAITSAPLPQSIKQDLEDLYACVVYKDDIFAYLKERERAFKPKPYYMKRQPDVNYNMRTILVDWLVEVGEEYKLSHQTLFLAINYIDRFLSCMAVVRGKLQLLGASAMFIAAKFEEIYPPEVTEFTYIADDTYTKRQVLRMESLIAKVLGYNLSVPTPYTFLTHVAASTKMSQKVLFLSIYICELSLLEADPYLEFRPSLVAAGAIALARHVFGYGEVWPSVLSQQTGYSLKQLATVVGHLNETHAKSFTSVQAATRDKYRSSNYLQVSNVPAKKLSIRVEN